MDDNIKNQRIEFCKKIPKLRTEMGMYQQQLADAIGIRQSSMSLIEQGKFSVGLDMLIKIAASLGYEIDFVEIQRKSRKYMKKEWK